MGRDNGREGGGNPLPFKVSAYGPASKYYCCLPVCTQYLDGREAVYNPSARLHK